MNYNVMTDLELLHYLDIYSDDPLIRRLVDVLTRTRGAIISDLENAGMDPQSWTFETEWQRMYPGDYIQQLRRDIEYAESELEDIRFKYEQAVEERNELKTRTIMEFIEEVRQEKRTADYTVAEARKETKRVAEENAKLKEQIDMWGRLNQVKQGA